MSERERTADRLVPYGDSSSEQDEASGSETCPRTDGSSGSSSGQGLKVTARGGTGTSKGQVSEAIGSDKGRKNKRTKLPPLDSQLSPLVQVEPEQDSQEGPTRKRRRTKKKEVVVGEWLCHVFIHVPSEVSIDKVISRSEDFVGNATLGSYQSLVKGDGDPAVDDPDSIGRLEEATGKEGGGEGDEDLESEPQRPHISLTRPILVRSHERESFWREAKDAIDSVKSKVGTFLISFARFDHLVNDDRTRDFMVMEVGAGWKELHTLSGSLSERLHRSFRAKPYYKEARYHASLGWVDMTAAESEGEEEEEEGNTTPNDKRKTLGGKSADPYQDPAHSVDLTPPSGTGVSQESPLNKVSVELEQEMGQELRGCLPLRVTSVGIRVGKRVRWVPIS
ncbi:hypothetical protein IE53DRAFT_389645 [Violaceomyces palustris]|uniref:Uncharacterized protein n=1 Tax=Violaceomyces palustris TaxID=1673888 RepID=A0ACD0NQT0_9BASI|nr:hypothetical protein IE53DRAFT_389645 [Violaceomyces palustris]